jgi:prophage regulatory protein
VDSAMQFLRVKQVMAMTGLSRMTIYRLEQAGTFPARRKLGKNSVAWIERDVTSSIESRPSGLADPRGAVAQLSLFASSQR